MFFLFQPINVISWPMLSVYVYIMQAQAEKLKAELEAAREAKKNAGSAGTPAPSGGPKTQDEDNVNVLFVVCLKYNHRGTPSLLILKCQWTCGPT